MNPDSRELQSLLTRLERELAAAPTMNAQSRASMQQLVQQLHLKLAEPPLKESTPVATQHGLTDLATRFEADHPDVAAALHAVVAALSRAGI